jgi:hypothetical protein
MQKFAILLTTLIVILTGCTKNAGLGGDNTIVATAKHHGLIISNATIYIKYNAKEFPGESTAVYDDYKTAGANGQVKFEGLKRGDYYFYGIGFDSTINQTVVGGIPVQLLQKSGEKIIDVPVTEGD